KFARPLSVGCLEGRDQPRVALQALGDRFERHVHLQLVLDRTDGLELQARDAAVPEEAFSPRCVYQRGRVARARATFDSDAEASGIGEGGGLHVAARTRDLLGARESLVEEEPLAE